MVTGRPHPASCAPAAAPPCIPHEPLRAPPRPQVSVTLWGAEGDSTVRFASEAEFLAALVVNKTFDFRLAGAKCARAPRPGARGRTAAAAGPLPRGRCT